MSADNNAGWCTIESDPAVFSEMIENIGVKDVVVEELWACDAGMVRELGEPLGLVLLFKYTDQVARLPRNVIADAPNMYFAKQIVGNACATQAILNTLLNHADSVELGDELKTFFEFTQHLPPDMRGEMIGQSDLLRAVHNSFTRTSMFSFEDPSRRSGKEDENYHFVTFTFKNDAVWELDGLRDGPVFIDSTTKDEWLDLACSAVQARIDELSALDTTGTGQGISFSMMAVVRDKLPGLKQQKAAAADDAQAAALAAQITELEEKRADGRAANVRRRHNYFPAVVALLRAMRDDGKLEGAIDAAKARAEQLAASEKARGGAVKQN